MKAWIVTSPVKPPETMNLVSKIITHVSIPAIHTIPALTPL